MGLGKIKYRVILMTVYTSYSEIYDLIYADKQYVEESNFLETVFSKYGKVKPKRILDVGCGTGGHSIPLSKKNYSVVGIDKSEHMIRIARKKSKDAKLNIEFYTMDLRELQLSTMFDACICLFSVLGYLLSDDDLIKSLNNIRKCLKRGSLFICDFWYGPAVLTNQPSHRLKHVHSNDIKIIRLAQPNLKPFSHSCVVNYTYYVFENDKLIIEDEEEHTIRYFFPMEIEYFLNLCNFKIHKFCKSFDTSKKPDETTWNTMIIAEAV